MWFLHKPPPPPPPPPSPAALLEQLRGLVVDQGSPNAAVLASLLVGLLLIWIFNRTADATEEEDDARLVQAEARRRAYREEVTRITFGALKSVAMADGHFHEKERELLEACTKVLTVRCPDVDEVQPLLPEQLACSVVANEPEKQAYLLMLMVHVALVDGDEHPAEYDLVKQHAQAMGVEDALLQSLRQNVIDDHERCKTSLATSAPTLARSSTAVVLHSPDFYSLLQSLCHR